MPVPQRLDMNKRDKYIKVYYNTHELMKIKDLAKKEHLQLSPYIRKKSLQEYLISTHKRYDPVERITRKDIEKKMIVDPQAKNFGAVLKELKQGFTLQPIGSFDTEINFIVGEVK